MNIWGDFMEFDLKPEAQIAIYDSGLGGISFLNEIVELLPNEDYLYFGDTAYAPYGTKDPEQVCERALSVVEALAAKDIKALVVACNTATSAAINDLRQAFPDLPILGMEPAIKPALESSADDVIVMATPLTAQSERLVNLIKKQKSEKPVNVLSCNGLMELVEYQAPEKRIIDYLEDRLAPYIDPEIRQAIVLGCTHYVFLMPLLNRLYPKIELYHGNRGTALHLCNILEEKDLLSLGKLGEPTLEIMASEDSDEFAKSCLAFLGNNNPYLY